MYSHPVDAYMVRREGDTLIAVPVRLTNVRPADLDAAHDDLIAGRIVFVAPRTMDELVFASYAPGGPSTGCLWHCLPPVRPSAIMPLAVGAWRSLVARFNGVEEVVGSSPAAPTYRQDAASFTGAAFLLSFTGVCCL